jgi:hypothetical protein
MEESDLDGVFVMTENNSWETLLFLGRARQLAEGCNPEATFRQALSAAEAKFGPESPEAGLCLMDLADCLEAAGKQAEADSLTERYRSIICLLVAGHRN